ncbi:HNH endonuclease [Pectobacterium odoriferum]|uniref:HNH endonuclease n=1 Tax=Pectobacterium TaxID=122277 RepID=UPI000CD1A7EF|nr:HNH endonuclease [Pectobacterium odoriferum]POE12474.1 HNH endonuclease [Pectobacterium odoriferum]
MHKLRKVKGIPKGYLEQIVAGKSGARSVRLTKILPDIRIRYAALENAFTIASISSVAKDAWTKQQREDLQHCYESTTQALEELKRLIKERQSEGTRDFCPYCGIGPPGQFDHYLPKEVFPEFSVHAHNLLPCCGTCNGKKSDVWLDAKNARVFLNFYLDSLPTAPILNPDVKWVTRKGKRVPTVSFDLMRPAGFSVGKFSLIETHVKKLDLLNRYKDQSHTEFLVLRDAAIARGAGTVATLRKFLENYLKQRERTLGPLNWRIALYRALVTDVIFLKECMKP